MPALMMASLTAFIPTPHSFARFAGVIESFFSAIEVHLLKV
jgi:hypothetical protein